MFVKVCGVRTVGDVDAAVEAGADAIGFVFAERSVRRVDPELAARLAGRVPDGVLTVGVFSDVSATAAGEIAVAVGLRAVQLHGDYPRTAFAELAGVPVQLIRATALKPTTDVEVGAFGEDLLLLDSPVAGSGERWDLATLDGARPEGKWILAGGLDPANVGAAIAASRPWGVDVSSGVESSRGVKDHGLIRDFVKAARSAT
ncbi:phosphoribosylanthranilate isomerase [Actinokineospora alba]|uniref:N-(5'-phosphoribosyl)anthranilate isomerase n=1 Tax=Actinokineospora alba TaxID=504798 RepID=A0A1H0HS48_9PSEU|nr:phosphoribosylanthranilate isomerase [Actinokineospora alba]TDP64770.1 phosphoribosylanthranilate isomerase [Actinokineospora alba]SDH45582.1 phosphoribosylanthranilate isomerase [Actinokineospora alba]SDO21963.1 phosphoribosylanthranilate isomerase [Actinokineospora alba]